MQTCTSSLPYCIKILYRGTCIFIGLDTTAHIMRCRYNWYQIVLNVDSYFEALCINGREVCHQHIFVNVPCIKVNMFVTRKFHFRIDCPCYNITRSKRTAFVVLHAEILAFAVAQYCTSTTHSLCNKKGRSLARIVKRCRMKLNKLHVLYSTLCPVNHCNTIACNMHRIGRTHISVSTSTSCNQGFLGVNIEYFLIINIVNVCTIAFYVGCSTRDFNAKMMLGY